MKKTALLAMATLALVLFGAMPSYADRGGGHFHHGGGHFGVGVVIGPGWGPWWPYYGNPYPYYAAPPVVIEREPEMYVSPQPQAQSYWYYCSDPRGYYPQVQRCPKGWMKVVPDSGAGPE